jgi:hypothetical protein
MGTFCKDRGLPKDRETTPMIRNSLLSKSMNQPAAAAHASVDFEDVVSAYLFHLEHSAPTPGCVADVRELPCSKETIKQALRWRMLRTPDADFRDTLKVAYVALSDWQEGVGAEHLGLDVGKLPAGMTVRERAEVIAGRVVEGATWAGRSNAEAKGLHRELSALGV